MYPTLIHFGHLTLPAFGVVVAVGLMLALWLSERTAGLVGVEASRLWTGGVFAVLSAFLLSRLLLVLFYWHSFRTFPILLLTVPSLTAPGLVLTGLATLGWLWWKRVPVWRALDAWAPCGAVVWACLALGHFAEGSDPGVVTTLPWGLPPMRGEMIRLHPVALYVAGFALLLAVLGYGWVARGVRGTAGYVLAVAGLGQFSASFVRQPGAEGWWSLDVLQWVALGMIVAGSVMVWAAPATINRDAL